MCICIYIIHIYSYTKSCILPTFILRAYQSQSRGDQSVINCIYPEASNLKSFLSWPVSYVKQHPTYLRLNYIIFFQLTGLQPMGLQLIEFGLEEKKIPLGSEKRPT